MSTLRRLAAVARLTRASAAWDAPVLLVPLRTEADAGGGGASRTGRADEGEAEDVEAARQHAAHLARVVADPDRHQAVDRRDAVSRRRRTSVRRRRPHDPQHMVLVRRRRPPLSPASSPIKSQGRGPISGLGSRAAYVANDDADSAGLPRRQRLGRRLVDSHVPHSRRAPGKGGEEGEEEGGQDGA